MQLEVDPERAVTFNFCFYFLYCVSVILHKIWLELTQANKCHMVYGSRKFSSNKKKLTFLFSDFELQCLILRVESNETVQRFKIYWPCFNAKHRLRDLIRKLNVAELICEETGHGKETSCYDKINDFRAWWVGSKNATFQENRCQDCRLHNS